MKKLIAIYLLVFGMLSLGFAQTDEWKTLDKDGYSIDYPSDWEANEEGMMGTSFVLFAPLSGEGDTFKENVNLIQQDLKGNDIDLDQYVELSVAQIKNFISNVKVLKNERQKEEEKVYHQLVYTGEQGPIKLTFHQFVFLENGIAYVVTLTTEQDQYDTYKATGEKILQSFALK